MDSSSKVLIAALALAAAVPQSRAQESAPEAAPAAAADPPLETIPVAAQEPAPASTDDSPTQLDDLTVTVNYRREDIQDVAGGAHVFGGRALDKAGATGLEDYLLEVPSVSLQKSGAGTAKIAIRGISNVNESDLGYADGSPTAGIYLNDVAIQGSGVFPDLNIYDLSRIEVLKGPQGTLYGEGSMGGAIKMITLQPEPNLWELRGNLMYGKTADGDDSHDGRIAVNVPLPGDNLGARLVGTRRVTGGFVDYTALNRKDADKESADSLRGIVNWEAFEKLGIEFMHLADHSRREQFPVVDEDRRDQRENSREEDQFAITDFTINALTARWELPFANLTSVSALYDTERDLKRRTPVLQSLLQTQFTFNGLGQAPDIFNNASTHVITDLDSFSQELRLVSFGGEKFDWILGGFYRDRTQTFDQEKREDRIPEGPIPFSGPLTGFNPVQGRQEKGFGEETFEQYAAYGELNWEIIQSKFDVTGGLRYFSEDVFFFIDTQFYGAEAFLFATDPTMVDPSNEGVRVYFEQAVKTDGLLPKLSSAWHFNDDHMIYATVSRGFRSGTANVYAALSAGPPIVQPDYVWNKELGAKSTWLDGTLTSNFSVYQLDWEDIQGTVLGRATLGAAEVDFAHLDNAGDAKVIGGEASLNWLPLDDLTLLFNIGYNRGEVTRARPGSQVREGSHLPNLPPLTGSTTASYSYALPWNLTADFSATYAFVDEQGVVFEPEPQEDPAGNEIPVTAALTIPSYNLLKAQLSLQRDQWRVQLFGENLLDENAVTAISAPIAQYTVITPRTLGIRLSYDF